MTMKNFNNSIGNGTGDHPACCAVPEPNAPKFIGLDFQFCLPHTIRSITFIHIVID
jgi:hypothetical protein